MGAPELLCKTRVLGQIFELLLRLGKVCFPLFDDDGRSLVKRFLRRDALQPSLLGKFFVAGKTEADEKANVLVGGWGRFRRSLFFGGGF
jgi:hypothetical protein